MTAITYQPVPQPRLAQPRLAQPRPARPRQPQPQPRQPQPRLRITRRGRTVLGALAPIPPLLIDLPLGTQAAEASGAGASGAAVPTTAGTAFEYASIAPGESLWQLAERIAPSADPREVVADILTLNNLRSADVQPGQKVAIPLEYAGT